MTTIAIRVVSDPICPWCFIGSRNLHRAIDLYKKVVPGGSKDTFTVRWHPFYLDPTLPKESVPYLEKAAKRHGGNLELVKSRVTKMGAAAGIKMSFNNRIGNTRDAHRLIALAKSKSLATQDQVVEELFQSYFERDGDITSHDMLADAASRAGIDRAEALRWLESDNGGAEVDEGVAWAQKQDIHGVPHFFINDTLELSGGQAVETFLEVLMKAREDAAAESVSGTVCEVGGNC